VIEPHLHPQATKHKEKRKKMRELDFLPRFGNGTHRIPETTKKKKKEKGVGLCRKLGMTPTKTKTKKKIKKENRMLTFKLVLPNSSLFKLQAP
jgi:hypothetical protein